MAGSFIAAGKAAQKVVVDLDSRRPAARKALAAELAAVNAGLAAGMSPEEIRALHATQEKQALLIAFTRLARYASPNEAVDFVEAMLAKVGGGKTHEPS